MEAPPFRLNIVSNTISRKVIPLPSLIKGDGSFTLNPGVSTIEQLSGKINQLMKREGVALEDMQN
jgi:hypothetical protein